MKNVRGVNRFGNPWIGVIAAVGLGLPVPVHALDRDTRAVLVASTWGVAAGSVLGAAGWAFSHNAKTLFQGSSLGLYFGIAFGLYHITHRDDPSNPLRVPANPGGEQRREWRRSEIPSDLRDSDREGWGQAGLERSLVLEHAQRTMPQGPLPTGVEAKFLVLQF